MIYVFHFLIWTFCIYWIHRLIHVTPILKQLHYDHHRSVTCGTHIGKWHYSNLLLFNDTWLSTVDLWITEVIPTIVISYILGAWWLCIFYYVWAAVFQESLEHNKKIDIYPITSGKWHLLHHRRPNFNFGLFFPVWDIIFRTQYKAKQSIR